MSSKRTQDSVDSGASGSEGAEPASKKRRRTSDSETDTQSDDGENGSRSSSPAEDETLDDEELLLRQTQILQEKYANIVDEANIPAEHGILESVDCYNFMCHDHFSVELGPLINFIVGKNGSGKSAILTALTLCLGGKASATNRGQSLKNFIKEGKENSNIVVRIKNQGDGAYLPDDFGKSIIVERYFSRSGSSGFKIKAANGRTISTKKSDLDSITDYFSLQIDNPMNVLSQDMARQFLSSSTPADKYRFFVKGVQLEQLDQDYRLIEESVDQIEEKLRNKAEDIRTLESRKDAAKKKLELSDKQDSLRDRIRNLRSQMAWAQVEEQERTRDSLGEELTKANESIANAEADMDQFNARLQAAEAEHDTASEHALQADRDREKGNMDKDKAQEELAEMMAKRHELSVHIPLPPPPITTFKLADTLQTEQRTVRDHFKLVEEKVSQQQKKIDAEIQRLAEVSDGAYARRQEEYDQATQRATAARAEEEEHREGEGILREEIQKADREVQSVQKLVDAKKKDIEDVQNRLRTLQKEDGQRKSGFHDKMPQLVRAIQQETSFTTPPVGPVGNYITLLKPKWSSILENAFGGTLNSFIVSSKQDMMTLSSLMRRVGCPCPILIGSDDYLDTSAHEPDPEFDTALRILQIDNSMVRSQLIIQHSVEQMLLIEDLIKATSVLFGGRRPTNVKRCYSLDVTDRRRGVTLSFNRTGLPSQAPVAMYNGQPRMKSDLASQISAQREVLDDLKRQLAELQQELQSAISRANDCKKALAQHGRRQRDLVVEVQRMDDEAEGLRNALDKDNVTDGTLDTLRIILKSNQEELETTQGTVNDCVTAMASMMQDLKHLRTTLKEKTDRVSVLVENSRVAESERHRVDGEKHQIIIEKNAAIERIKEQKEVRKKIEENWAQYAERVSDYNEKASMVSPRVPVDEGETPTSLDEKLARLSQDLDRYSQQLGATREEIAAEATRRETAYVQAMTQVDELRTLAQIFKDTLNNRKKRWEIFRSHISSRAKAQFTYLLSERSFRGRLLTDHKGKLLDLQVEPDITKDDSTGRGAKTLSGGEKSFSQICLLLALWEAMGSPIRCLDEFDVYMDHINRRMSIDMLMTAARRSIGRQFILITPGTRTDITIAADVRVKELAEPERGQSTLTFQRA
ncbi:hypothetical protein N7495_009824 [Penicillium taxi]|uniref:uncharacterized protein n=1 Tax=Penicillium taxi TaxID=168475 RepID=UPI0025450BDB|nr:uncharacterized protein N7495_009824 [Penicillium taxi]KAJ5885314.1 hypothetical protein N7495_009824 [Penicillium taxi]